MKVQRFGVRLGLSIVGAVAIASLSQPGCWPRTITGIRRQRNAVRTRRKSAARRSAFVRAVREATRRFLDPAVAMSEGYLPQFGCVTGSSEGVMGVHFVNGGLVNDGELHVEHPELLVYEPLPNNRFQLVAADYLVTSEAWHATNPAPPQLMGQLFHLFESPTGSGCRSSTRCTCGPGRTTRRARSPTGIPTCRATRKIRRISERSARSLLIQENCDAIHNHPHRRCFGHRPDRCDAHAICGASAQVRSRERVLHRGLRGAARRRLSRVSRCRANSAAAGCSLAEVVREQRRLGSYAPATALAINMHLYWTGVAADLVACGRSLPARGCWKRPRAARSSPPATPRAATTSRCCCRPRRPNAWKAATGSPAASRSAA